MLDEVLTTRPPASSHESRVSADCVERVPRGVLVGFSLGSLGTGIFSITPSVLLLYFLTDVLGLAAGLAALAVSLPKFWDVVTDPIMGIISDRTRSRWGRRRPYLLLGAILMAISFVFLFSVPAGLSEDGQFWYVLVVFTLSATAYTVFAVPYVAMPAEMSKDPHERTVIMSYRMTFALAGLLIGATAAPLLVDWFGGGRSGYAAMSYVVGGFCALTMLLAFFAARHAPSTSPTTSTLSMQAQIRSGLRNRPFFVLLAAYFIQLAGIATFLAAAPFFVVYIAEDGASATGMIFLFLMSAGLVSMPLWTVLSARYGKLACFRAAALAYAAISLCFILVDVRASDSMLHILAAVLGIPFGCIMMMPFSMLTDTVHYDSAVTGLQREGVFTGMWTAGEKSGLAVGAMVVGVILSLSGFSEAHEGIRAPQSASAITGIKLAFAVVPAAFALASVLLLRFYKLPRLTLESPAREETPS